VFLFCAAAAIASPAQTLTTLVNFNFTNGANPFAGLVQASDGNFYGTTEGGSSPNCVNDGCGTVFKITAAGALTTLHSFNGTDGDYPYAALVQGTDGNLYGTTSGDGTRSYGTIFKITTGGVLTTLHSFALVDGEKPAGGLIEATDGDFYGTTVLGGTYGAGTVFKITAAGALTTLYSFNGTDGDYPYAALVQGTDGNLYGTTSGDQTRSYGTVFKITTGGMLTTLYSFQGTDGDSPYAALVQGTDGNFYGTTVLGGANGAGTVFNITSEGVLTTLHSFDRADGEQPAGGLIEATDGNFYGTTFASGANGGGTVFKISPSGIVTTLYNFCSLSNCADGGNPRAGLVQATNGSLYDTTYSGGSSGDCRYGCGTVFTLTGPSPAAVQLVPVTPCRLVDTRNGNPIQGGTWQDFIVPQLGGCNIPTNATAYSLNVTVVPHGPLGYLTIWPASRTQPYVSTMNSLDGRVKANAAIVPAGASGAVSVYVTQTTDVILDIDGYFAPAASGTYQFYTLTPCRVVDTRDSTKPQGLGPPSLGNMETRDLPLLTSPCLQNLPQQPQAYSFNVTVVPNPIGQPLNYLTVWPSDQNQPVVSTLNNPTATVVANAAIVQAAADGDIDVFTYNSTDLIIDVNGYFAAPGGQNALSLYPVAPCRVIDTRQVGNGQPIQNDLTVNVAGSPCAPPSSAQAYVFNATVVPSGFLDYLTLWPDSENQPVVSTLNAYDGFITSNMAIVPNVDGSIDAYASQLTQLILDISGYFAP